MLPSPRVLTLAPRTLHLAPGRPRGHGAVEHLVEGAGAPTDDRGEGAANELGEVAEAPEGHPRYRRRRGRIAGGERVPFPLVPHHASEVGARQASAWDAMEDHEVGIVDDGAARLEHAPHDIYVLITIAPAPHRPQRDIEAAQGEERRAPVHHVGPPHLGMA